MKVSLVLVHYHAAELAVAAAAALRRQAAEAGVGWQEVVVDNGSDAAGAGLLAEAFPGSVVDPGDNLGYAGGVSRGAAAAEGDVLLIANPDLVPLAGALEALLAALRDGAGVAGPRFFWDRERRLLLPPNERRDPLSVTLSRLALRGDGWARRARRRWRRHARRHWRADGVTPTYDLSGALLAVDRGAWERVGPFDAGYRLYFEEVDWLRRCRQAGVRAVLQPRAEVVHHYDRSAAGEERAEDWYAESAARFEERWHGAAWRSLWSRLTPPAPRLQAEPPLPGAAAGSRHDEPPQLGAARLAALRSATADGELWIELSPSPVGFPAAAERLPAAAGDGGAGRGTVPAPGVPAAGEGEPWRLPAEPWSSMRPGRWRLAVVDGRGRELDAAGFTAGEGDVGSVTRSARHQGAASPTGGVAGTAGAGGSPAAGEPSSGTEPGPGSGSPGSAAGDDPEGA